MSECELCAAAKTTEWYYEDELCWVAECESCFVPMVVWRRHDANPPAEVRVELHRTLTAVLERHFVLDVATECWFDDNMRSIPCHYHAHARHRGGGFGHRWRRRPAGVEADETRD